MIGNGDGCLGGTNAHQGRLVAGGQHHHRLFQARLAQAVVEEGTHLTAPFSDQGDDIDVGLAALGNLSQERAFADAAAGEDADALAPTQGQQSINGALAGDERLADTGPFHGRRRFASQGRHLEVLQGAPSIDRSAQPVDGPSQQALPDGDQ